MENLTSKEFTIEIVDRITKCCMDLYSKLPKTGKPLKNEWTVLSCIIKYEQASTEIEVVSLGTGSKCIGASKMCPTGGILNDSHAEVFARRGLLLYLYDNMKKCINNQPSIFRLSSSEFKLREGIGFVFYSSQLPCGDASIIPKGGDKEHFGDILNDEISCDGDSVTPCKKRKIEDIHRTGAKCLPHSEQDPKEFGSNYHILGQVRTKPGRGDRTLSVSCSDKIARWVHLGIQGSLLSLLCEPIYIKYFVFGANMPYSEDTLKRALLKNNNYVPVVPKFYQSTIPFTDIRNKDRIKPAPGSIVWVNTENKIQEVAVQGKKLGITKKQASSVYSLCISKYNLYRKFIEILSMDKNIRTKIVSDEDLQSIPYNVMKSRSKYTKNWHLVKEKVFKTWTIKPDIWTFYVDVSAS